MPDSLVTGDLMRRLWPLLLAVLALVVLPLLAFGQALLTLARDGAGYRLDAPPAPGVYALTGPGVSGTLTVVGIDAGPPDAPPDIPVDTAPSPPDAPPTGGRCALRSQPKPAVPVPSGVIVNVPAGASLQAAIDGAPSGASLVLAPGTWTEHVLSRGKSVRIFGAGQGLTVWQGPTAGRTGSLFAVSQGSTATSVTVANLTMTGGVRAIDVMGTSGALSVLVHGVELAGNGIGDLASLHRGSAVFSRWANIEVRESWIHDNVGSYGAALNIGVPGTAVVADSVLERNVSYADHGGAAWFSAPALLLCNEWRANEVGRYTTGGGWGAAWIMLHATSSHSELNIVTGNIASGRGAAYWDEGAHGTSTRDVVSFNSILTGRNSSGSGVYVDGPGSGVAIVGLEAIGNTGPGPYGGNGVFVSGNSWATVTASNLANGDDWYVRTSDGSTLTVTSTTSQEAAP